MFKHYGSDAREGSFSLCIPQQVLTSTAQVKHFWDQLRSAAPREKREHIARTEWMMSTWDCRLFDGKQSCESIKRVKYTMGRGQHLRLVHLVSCWMNLWMFIPLYFGVLWSV